MAMQNNDIEYFFSKLQTYIDRLELIKLILSKKKKKSYEVEKITVSLVKLKKGINLKFVYTYKNKEITKIFATDEAVVAIREELSTNYYNSDLYAAYENINFISSKKGKINIKTTKVRNRTSCDLSHNKAKRRLITSEGNPYLKQLGIVSSDGNIIGNKNDKFRQINRYVEILEPYFSDFDREKSISIFDMGCGKGYLTFALYDYLANSLSLQVKMTGVEFRKELVRKSNLLADDIGFDNLNFVEGSIIDTDFKDVDVIVALHACDTATDDAIYKGIMNDAKLIVCAPCCHKQVRKDMNTADSLSNITKHGILKERQAEIVTDTLRAMIMEYYGYRSNIVEFISPEHTPKNLLLIGKKITDNIKQNKALLNDINSIKELFGVKRHYLEELLGL